MAAYVLYRVTCVESQNPKVVYTALGRLEDLTTAKASNTNHIPSCSPVSQTYVCLFEPTNKYDNRPLINDYRTPE